MDSGDDEKFTTTVRSLRGEAATMAAAEKRDTRKAAIEVKLCFCLQ